MSDGKELDPRLSVPYSISTGIPSGGDAEIEGYIESLRLQGFCVIDRVIPQDQVDAARHSVLEGRVLLQEDRAKERQARVEWMRAPPHICIRVQRDLDDSQGKVAARM